MYFSPPLPDANPCLQTTPACISNTIQSTFVRHLEKSSWWWRKLSKPVLAYADVSLCIQSRISCPSLSATLFPLLRASLPQMLISWFPFFFHTIYITLHIISEWSGNKAYSDKGLLFSSNNSLWKKKLWTWSWVARAQTFNFTPEVPVLLLQIAAESETVDDELIRKAAGVDGDPDEVAEGSGSLSCWQQLRAQQGELMVIGHLSGPLSTGWCPAVAEENQEVS